MIDTNCTRQATSNVKDSSTTVYFTQHSPDIMVALYRKRWLKDLFMKLRSLSVEGSKTPVYCTKHAKSRIVGVYARRRLNDACMYLSLIHI